MTPCHEVPREISEKMMKYLEECKDKRKDKEKRREELESHLKETGVWGL